MRVDRRVAINTVAFIVGSAILFIAMGMQILPSVFRDTYSVYGEFPHAGGVFTNQEVTYRGVQVGTVGTMELTDDAVRIEMVIQSRYRIPKQGTRLRVQYKSAVGEQFIDILPETSGSPFFQEGDEVPLQMTSVPIFTEDLLRELDAVLGSLDPEALGTLVHELGTGLRGHGNDLKQILLALDTLAGIGAAHTAEIQTGITSAADLQEAFNSSREEFVAASGSLKTIASSLATRREDLLRTLDAARPLDKELIRLLTTRKAEIEAILADAGTVTRLGHAQREDLNLLLSYLAGFLNDIHRAYAAPFFKFNVVTDSSPQSCSYDPSSRPMRGVTETSFKQPETRFKCM